MDDGLASYLIGHAALREIKIRDGREPPLTLDEWRWFADGSVPPGQLETVLKGLPARDRIHKAKYRGRPSG